MDVRNRWMFATLLALVLGVGSAQSFGVGVGASAAAPQAWLRFEGVRVADATATLELRLARVSQLGLGLSANESFGPLGNVVFEAWGALRTDGRAEGRLGARGVIGPVALRAAVVGFGAEVGAFRPPETASAERPVLSGPAAGVQLGVSARLDRTVILDAAPELYLAAGRLALRLDATLRLLRALGPNELRLLVHAYGTPGLASGSGAVGVGVLFPRGRDPDLGVALSVGLSSAGVLPGASVRLEERVGDVRLALDAAFEPYRLDVRPLRLAGTARLPLTDALGAGSELTLEAALAGGAGLAAAPMDGTRWWLGAALSLPFGAR